MRLTTLLVAFVLVAHADKDKAKSEDEAGAPAAAKDKEKKKTTYVPPVGKNKIDPRLQAALSAASPADCDLQSCDNCHP